MRVLDLFAGVGGAAKGYHDAGFEVEGVDNKRQPDYPYRFYCTGALGILKGTGCGPGFLPRFDLIHASPPCQAYSRITPRQDQHPDLLAIVRDLLNATGIPWVMENVVGAPMNKAKSITLCGAMFDLPIIRHRIFEVSDGLTLTAPVHRKHPRDFVQVYGKGGWKGRLPEWQNAMQMPWTNSMYGIGQAVPPAYAREVGRQLMPQLLASKTDARRSGNSADLSVGSV